MDDIITKHKDESGNIVLTKQFINDIVANHQYIMTYGCVIIPAMACMYKPHLYEDMKRELGVQDSTTIYSYPSTSLVNLDFCIFPFGENPFGGCLLIQAQFARIFFVPGGRCLGL